MGEQPRIDHVRDGRARRVELLSKIGAARKSFVISYLTSTRPGAIGRSMQRRDVEIIEPHVRAAKAQNAASLDLILLTEGGSSVAPWDLVAMVREYFPDKSFRVIVPSVAYSAGATICLGADDIVMGPGSVLGPVDAQVDSGGELGSFSASAFQGFLDAMKHLGVPLWRRRSRGMDWLTTKLNALQAGEAFRLWHEDRRIINNLLNSRRNRLSRRANERILSFLLYQVADHAQPIRRKEARQNGISFITDIEKTNVEGLVTDLFREYENVMLLNVPLARRAELLRRQPLPGDEDDKDVRGVPVSSTPIAIVESAHDCNPAYIAYALRHWNEVPKVDEDVAPPKPDKRVEHHFAANSSLKWDSVGKRW